MTKEAPKPPLTQGQYLRKLFDEVHPSEEELAQLREDLPQIASGDDPLPLMLSDQLRVPHTAIESFARHAVGEDKKERVNKGLLLQITERDEGMVLKVAGQTGMRRVLLVYLGHIFSKLSDEEVHEILSPVAAAAARIIPDPVVVKPKRGGRIPKGEEDKPS